MKKIIHNLTEEQISNQCVFSGDLLQVHVDNVVMPDGKLSVREYVTHPGAVVIIPLLDNVIWYSSGNIDIHYTRIFTNYPQVR